MKRFARLTVPVYNGKDTHFEMISIIQDGESVQVSKLDYKADTGEEILYQTSVNNHNMNWTIESRDKFDNMDQAHNVFIELLTKYGSYDPRS